MTMPRLASRTLLILLLSLPLTGWGAEKLVVASKNFNEGYLLGELMAQVLENHGYEVERRFGLGGTLVCYEALLAGEVDVYGEYTGTLAQAILKVDDLAPDRARLNTLLHDSPVEVLDSLGFNNTYAIALKAGLSRSLNVTKISDLALHNELTYAFSLEFLNRQDGWPGLAQTYGLTSAPTGIEHGLAYQAMDEGKIDITDAYSTDGDLKRYGLVTLTDDREYFPQYFAVPFVRKDLPPAARQALGKLAGRIDDDTMRQLNAQVVIEGRSFAEVAAGFLQQSGLGGEERELDDWQDQLARNTLTHLKLTFIALALGCMVGLPLGILVYRHKTLSRLVLYVAGLLQTVPSIALLALMIPLFGIGEVPAIIALFLYSILPILRNTITGLITIDPLLKRVAEAIGLNNREQLVRILLPMAMPTILAGIRTAAVISIGTATLAAFIGAGGLGEPIVTGLALNDASLILQGAVPAAMLAIVTELLFEGLERLLVKPHMLKGQLPE
ncbi:MAG: ABC transporter permease subunit [Pseudomonadales bacterium]|nr:ABC transporter permease subunit [Pseudomonadales bacterium]